MKEFLLENENLPWSDRTYSMLLLAREEACEKRLLRLSSCSRLDMDDLNGADAEKLWAMSCYARQDGSAGKLHTVRELAAMVMNNMTRDAAFMSVGEEVLVNKLTHMKGGVIYPDQGELPAAESLVRRLWAYTENQDGRIAIRMSITVRIHLLCLLSSKDFKEMRNALRALNDTVTDILYLSGAVRLDEKLTAMAMQYLQMLPEELLKEDLVTGFLIRSFRHVYGKDGIPVLVHDAMIDPEKTIRGIPSCSCLCEDELDTAIAAMDEEEILLGQQLIGSVGLAVRQEIDPHDAVQDLILLAKQDVSIEVMLEVLKSVISVRPTEEMLRTVRHVWENATRWLCLPPGKVS